MGRKTLVIGIGESGCNVAQSCAKRMKKESDSFVCFAMDADLHNLATKTDVYTIPISDNRRMEDHLIDVGNSGIEDWLAIYTDSYAAEYVKSLEMHKGSNLWRAKGALAFISYLANSENKEKFEIALDSFVESVDSETELNVFIATSLCGGTGSGAFILVSLYVKQYLENKTGRKVNVNAFLLCSDIYENQLSQEQMVKASANAYAALREINAINTVCFGNDVQENCFSVNFKLGSKKDNAMGLLFDSEDEDFQCETAAPFHRIYLFEKQLGRQSIGAHEEMVADVISLMGCQDFLQGWEKDYGIAVEKDAIYRSVSLTKVKYPKESVAKYIVKKGVYDRMKEWQDVHSVVMDRVKQYRVENFHARKTDTKELYPSLFLNTVNEKYEVEGKDELKEKEKLGAEIFDVIDDAMALANREEIPSMLAEGEALLQQKLPKKELRTNLEDKKQKLLAFLAEFYESGLELLREQNVFLSQQIEQSAQSDSDSIIQRILQVDGQIASPTVSLMRLIQCKELLESKIQKNDVFSDSFLQIESTPQFNDEYLDWELENITDSKNATLAAQAKDFGKQKFRGKYKDWLKFAEKYRITFEWIAATMNATVCASLLTHINNYISNAISVFCHSDGFMQNLAFDVHLALAENCETSELYANVYVSEEDKLCAYNSYLSQKADHLDFETEKLEKLSGIFQTLSFDMEDESQLGAKLTGFIDKALSELIESFTQTKFYQEHLDKDIINVLTNPSPIVAADASSKSRNVTLRKLLTAGRPALKTNIIDNEKERLVMRTERAVVFAKSSDGDDSERLEKINAMLLDAGEHDSSVKFAECCTEEAMLIYKEMKNVRLSRITFMDESSSDMLGYKSCEKSLQMMQKQFSQLWNPYLTNKGQSGLPFINEEIQTENEKKFVKALLYALLKNKLYLAKDENGKQVYFTDRNEDSLPITVNEERVKKGQYHKLIEWISQNPEQIKWRDAYNYHLSREITDYALNGASLDGADKLLALAKTLPLFGGMMQGLFQIAYILKKDYNFAFYARQMLILGDEAATAFSMKWQHKGEELSEQIRRVFIDEFKQEFVKAEKKLTNEELTDFESFIANIGCYTYKNTSGEIKKLQF